MACCELPMCEFIHLTRIDFRVRRKLGDVSPFDVDHWGWSRLNVPPLASWELEFAGSNSVQGIGDMCDVFHYHNKPNDITGSGQLPRDGFVILTQLFLSRLWLFFCWNVSSARMYFISLWLNELAAIWRHNALVNLSNFSIFRNDLFLSKSPKSSPDNLSLSVLSGSPYEADKRAGKRHYCLHFFHHSFSLVNCYHWLVSLTTLHVLTGPCWTER